jgi:DNA-binding transcriptional MocR family regulator
VAVLLDLIVGAVVALVSSVIACGVLIGAGIVDMPSEPRKRHRAPTPTSGGIGIAIGVAVGLMTLSLFSTVWRHEITANGAAMSSMGAAFAYSFLILGFVDDAYPLGPRLKFIVFAALSVFAALAVGLVRVLPLGETSLELGFIVALIGTAAWVFTLVNCVNFMDGANGLAMGSVAIGLVALAVVGVSLHAFSGAAIAVCGAGALIGFLVWNFPGGRLFAGDSGALFAGAIAAMAVLVSYYVKRAARPMEEPAVSKPPQRALAVEVNALADVMLAATQEPKMVSFGSACPMGDLFPLERIRRVLSSLARRDRHALGRYGLPPGTEALRRAIARRALEWGCRIDHRNLVITNGCMEALNLCLRAVTQPGDTVALESPTYYGFLQILQALGLKALEIPTHPRSGISLEALELALEAHAVKAVLVMPNVSNPVGATMSDAAKKRLVGILAAKGVPLIEDHIFAELAYDAAARRAAKCFDRGGNVMLCSSFSKSLAPGLKAGFIEPGRWHDAIRTLKFVASGGNSEVVELTLAELLESGGYERSLRQLRRRFEQQVDAARGVIAESFPRGTKVTRPTGGFILWVELPKACDTIALFEKLLERSISIAPGPMFSATQRYRNCMRVSVGQLWTERTERALREVGTLARQQIGESAVSA